MPIPAKVSWSVTSHNCKRWQCIGKDSGVWSESINPPPNPCCKTGTAMKEFPSMPMVLDLMYGENANTALLIDKIN
jgi:hypothetical protein